MRATANKAQHARGARARREPSQRLAASPLFAAETSRAHAWHRPCCIDLTEGKTMLTFVSIPVVLGSQASAVATGWAPAVPLLTVGVAAVAPLVWGLAGLAVI